MSGGRFDYKQRAILDIAESLQEILDRQGKKKDAEDLTGYPPGFFDDYPEEKYYETFSPEMQMKMNKGIKLMKYAYVYAQRLDWYLSGDDSEETFYERLSEDIINS